MGKSLTLGLIFTALLAAPALAMEHSQPSQAAERFIVTKLGCDNMSKLQKDVCLRTAEMEFAHAMHNHAL